MSRASGVRRVQDIDEITQLVEVATNDEMFPVPPFALPTRGRVNATAAACGFFGKRARVGLERLSNVTAASSKTASNPI
jgi:hypothetical protein